MLGTALSQLDGDGLADAACMSAPGHNRYLVGKWSHDGLSPSRFDTMVSLLLLCHSPVSPPRASLSSRQLIERCFAEPCGETAIDVDGLSINEAAIIRGKKVDQGGYFLRLGNAP